MKWRRAMLGMLGLLLAFSLSSAVWASEDKPTEGGSLLGTVIGLAMLVAVGGFAVYQFGLTDRLRRRLDEEGKRFDANLARGDYKAADAQVSRLSRH
ncbi:hypothetical protein HYW67_00920 [Candidatus Parcubacteria bacterium]|nr:hypothetical protein [Candidatus Parcubacteria bacterium]